MKNTKSFGQNLIEKMDEDNSVYDASGFRKYVQVSSDTDHTVSIFHNGSHICYATPNCAAHEIDERLEKGFSSKDSYKFV